MNIKNPILDLEPEFSLRDPALFKKNNEIYCFFSLVKYKLFKYYFYLYYSKSKDLINWSYPKILFDSDKGFSSPGNIIKTENEYILCFQTYPIDRFKMYANEKARLWISRSKDLENWSKPVILVKEGCRADWTKSKRQIDPYLIIHDDYYWCVYKTSGNLGLIRSDNLIDWKEISKEKPILSKNSTPDKHSLENPCIIKIKDEFVMYFARVGVKRGIGIAKSSDLINWYGIRYINFPKLKWARGPTAPFVIDLRDILGKWIMVFHGDRKPPHGGALGISWSDDLEKWFI